MPLTYLKQIWAILPLFFIILIDIMGICLVFPVLTPLFFDPTSGLLADGVSTLNRSFLYGLAMSLYPLFMFIGAPIFGDLSDRMGRKKVLLICLLGTAVGYQVSAFGIDYHNLTLLLLGRAICGLFAGSQPIAQAAIADVSTTHNKASNMSIMTLAAALGIIIGPLIGGYTSDSKLFSFFSLSTPFTVGGLFALLNSVLLIFLFKETFVAKIREGKLILHKGFHLFLDAFRHRDWSVLSLSLVLFQCAWGFYIQVILWLMQANYHYDNKELGLFLAFIGIGFVLSATVLVHLALRYLKNEIKICILSILIMTIMFLLASVISNEQVHWWIALVASAMNVIGYTLYLTLFSNSADKDSQGWVMGITGSVCAAAWGVTGLLIGPLGFIDMLLPVYIATILGVFALMVLLYYAKVTLKQRALEEVGS